MADINKKPATMSAGIDHNYPIAGRYEYVLFAEDETIITRATAFRSKGAAINAGRKMAEELLKTH